MRRLAFALTAASVMVTATASSAWSLESELKQLLEPYRKAPLEPNAFRLFIYPSLSGRSVLVDMKAVNKNDAKGSAFFYSLGADNKVKQTGEMPIYLPRRDYDVLVSLIGTRLERHNMIQNSKSPNQSTCLDGSDYVLQFSADGKRADGSSHLCGDPEFDIIVWSISRMLAEQITRYVGRDIYR